MKVLEEAGKAHSDLLSMHGNLKGLYGEFCYMLKNEQNELENANEEVTEE